MGLSFNFFVKVFGVLMLLICVPTFSKSKSSLKVKCPEEGDEGCVLCRCDTVTGYNECFPTDGCAPIMAASQTMKKKDKQSICPYGKLFSALCYGCRCSGFGRDHCDLCTALPVRRDGQPDTVNKKLPPITDNRFFNYEINGWII